MVVGILDAHEVGRVHLLHPKRLVMDEPAGHVTNANDEAEPIREGLNQGRGLHRVDFIRQVVENPERQVHLSVRTPGGV